jgi:hypothetical protein
MAGFVNGLANVGTAIGNYELAKKRRGLLGAVAGQFLPNGIPSGGGASAPPTGPLNTMDTSPLPASPSPALTPPPSQPDAGMPPQDDTQDVSGAQPMAHGGMVTRPTLAIIAEKGPEVVARVGRYRRQP